MFLADFHIHSTFSDGSMAIPDVIDLYGRHGFGAIAITDHLCERKTLIGRVARHIEHTLTPATFPLYIEVLRTEAERAWDEYKMVVIPGFELSKNSVSNNRSAHIVALNVSEYLPADGSVQDLARAIRARNGLAIAAHPVFTQKLEKQTFYLWNHRFDLGSEFDAWEVASGPYFFEKVLRSGLPMIASSDFHTMADFESWKSVLTCERDAESVLKAVRRQEIDFTFFQNKERNYDIRDDSMHDGLAQRDRYTGARDASILETLPKHTKTPRRAI
jgi:predicted metal-dependent phosphoesterase TrpH